MTSNPFLTGSPPRWDMRRADWRCPIMLAFWQQHTRAAYIRWLAGDDHHPDGVTNESDVSSVSKLLTVGDELHARCRSWLNDHPETECPYHPDGHAGLVPADFDDLGDGTLPAGILDFTCGGPDAHPIGRYGGCPLHRYVWRRSGSSGFWYWTEGARQVHPTQWYSSAAPYTGAALRLSPWWNGIGWAPSFRGGPDLSPHPPGPAIVVQGA